MDHPAFLSYRAYAREAMRRGEEDFMTFNQWLKSEVRDNPYPYSIVEKMKDRQKHYYNFLLGNMASTLDPGSTKAMADEVAVAHAMQRYKNAKNRKHVVELTRKKPYM